MRIFALSPEQVEHVWPDFEPLMQKMEAVGDLGAQTIRKNAADGLLQIFGIQDDEQVRGVALTEVMETPSGLILGIIGAVGAARGPLQERLLDEIGKWGASIGCRAVRIHGRKGWVRRFPRFKPTGIVAEWPLQKVH